MKNNENAIRIKSELFEKLSYDEQDHICELLGTWLNMYIDDVVRKVLKNIDAILSNEFAIKMLEELHERETKERKDFNRTIGSYVKGFIDTDTNLRFNVLTHSHAYRHILYDMYIEEEKE